MGRVLVVKPLKEKLKERLCNDNIGRTFFIFLRSRPYGQMVKAVVMPSVMFHFEHKQKMTQCYFCSLTVFQQQFVFFSTRVYNALALTVVDGSH